MIRSHDGTSPRVPPSPPSRYFELSTDPVPATQRREFWRDVALNRSEADFPRDDRRVGFDARVKVFLGTRSHLRVGESDPVILRRSAAVCRRDGSDEVLLSTVTAFDRPGRYSMSGKDTIVHAGDIMICDMSRPFVIDVGRYREVNFRLPRAAVMSAVGADPAFLGGRKLPATPLTALLFGQLSLFADALPKLGDAARAVALGSLTDFALAALRLESRSADWEEGPQLDWFWQATARFIDANLGRSDLTPSSLAKALHCSRSQVYRLFAQRGLTVMGYLYEQRLMRSREMLEDPGCRLPIADIAQACGFEEPSAFSRSFKQRFNCQPRDVRVAARGKPAG
ncbi:MAG TPA: AraC family transcriptional regulator [Acetobacteraceae bacterium]